MFENKPCGKYFNKNIVHTAFCGSVYIVCNENKEHETEKWQCVEYIVYNENKRRTKFKDMEL